MSSDRYNKQSLKYQRFTLSGLKDIGINESSLRQLSRDWSICVDIVNLERLVSIFYVGTLKFENRCLIPKSRDINHCVDLHKIEINA